MAHPLQVTVVGAGIGGLAAAIAFRRNGHNVQIFEVTAVKTEVGAGIGLQVNALRVLEHLGVVKEHLKGVSYDGITTFDGKTGEGVTGRWLLPDMGQNKNILCHRTDVHDELMRLAIGEEGQGPPIQLHLGCKVIDCDPQKGTVTLQDGKIIEADIVIGADGLRSTMRAKILGNSVKAPVSGISCFRSVIPASRLNEIPAEHSTWYTEGISGLRGIVVKEGGYRMIVSYPCRSGTLVNLVALYADPYQDDPDWSSTGTREELLEHFHDLHPKFVALLGLVDEDKPVLKWQLRVLSLLPTWINGRAALLGDAAHATLPTLGQGAAAAIEEAGALNVLFPLGVKKEDIPGRLKAYETIRKPRGDYINRESLAQGTVPTKRGLYLRSSEIQAALLQHNAIKEAQEYYADHFRG